MFQYAFSVFTTPSCKWDKVCIVNPTNLVIWFEAPITFLYDMFTCFLLLYLWFIIEKKSDGLETSLWKYILHRTLRSNIYDKIYGFDLEGRKEIFLGKLVFRLPFLFSLINQKPGDENNINIWHQEPNFNLNQRSNFTDLRLCSMDKMAWWSPKKRILTLKRSNFIHTKALEFHLKDLFINVMNQWKNSGLLVCINMISIGTIKASLHI